MKIRFLLLAGILGLGMLSACSNDDEVNGNAPEKGNTYAQIAINIASTSSATTRVDGSTGDYNEGTEAEYKVTDITVVLANEAHIAQQIIKPGMQELSDNDVTDKRATKPFNIPAGKYRVYVLANYDTGALSPIIKNSTDMSNYFSITDAGKLSVTDKFLMVNTTVPGFNEYNDKTETQKEFDDDGNVKSDSEIEVIKLEVDIERVVAKVTFDQTETTFEIKDGIGNKVAGVTLNGVGIINLNKKMNLIKDGNKAVNYPTAVTDWIYPKDPNYDKVLTGSEEEETWLADNFTSQNADIKAGFTSIFYTPENTMVAEAQQNGQTTGVVYETTVTPEAEAYTELDPNGSDEYSKKFAKVLGETDKSNMNKDIFTTDDGTNFYTWNNLIFKNQNAAALYMAIANAETGATAASIVTAYNTNKDNTDGSILKYTNGKSYYPVWIKHNPEATEANEQDKYGVVRNHWYDLEVVNVKKLGYNKPTYKDPTDPDDPEEASIEVLATIKKWRLVKQEIELQ